MARAKYVDAVNPSLRGAADLAGLYGGIDYDRDAIEGIFQNATNSKYDAQRADYKRHMGTMYKGLGTMQNAYLDTVRRSNAAALQSGASQGVQAANELSTLLGLSQQSNDSLTELVQQERALDDTYRAEQAQNTRDALQYANEVKMGLGTLGTNIYSVDTQKYAAQLGYNAQLEVAAAQRAAAASAGSAQKYYAELMADAQKYGVDKGYSQHLLSVFADLYKNPSNEMDRRDFFGHLSATSGMIPGLGNMSAEDFMRFMAQSSGGNLTKLPK